MVGDDNSYGRFRNAPLPDDREVLFVLAVASIYEGVTKASFSEPSKPLGVEIAEGDTKPVGAVAQVPQSNLQTPVIVEEDSNGNGNNIIKLLEETDLLDKIPARKTKPISGSRSGSATRRQRLPYRSPPPLVIGLSAAIGVLGFLLLLSIAVYFYLRHRVHRNDLSRRSRSRRPSDRQGLTMHGGSTSTIELVLKIQLNQNCSV